MRLSVVLLGGLLIGIGNLHPAAARNVNYSDAPYTACSCHFGYGNVCSPAVSCLSEGGRCSGSCNTTDSATR
jgi:hypothetical protein